MILIRDNLSVLSSTIKSTLINNKVEFIVPFNKLVYDIIHLFYKDGYISSYKILNLTNKSYIFCILKKENDITLIHSLQRISTPGQKKYTTYSHLKKIYTYIQGDTNYIISTSSGVYSGKICLIRKLSGEILFKIN